MKSHLETTPEAVAAAFETYRDCLKSDMNPSSAMRAALASALPFCKPEFANARLRLFDGRFTLPLVVKSYPGVSFIHPANCESAPVAVVTCDDHPTVAAGIVDAIAAASAEEKAAKRAEFDAGVAKVMSMSEARFREANADAMKTIRAACGASLEKSWAEKARELYGDHEPAILRTIGAALAEIAVQLPGPIYIEVGGEDPGRAPRVSNNVVVNLSVDAASVDPERAQKMADEIRNAVERELHQSARLNVSPDIEIDPDEAEKVTGDLLSKALETIEKTLDELRATGHQANGAPLHILVDRAIDRERERALERVREALSTAASFLTCYAGSSRDEIAAALRGETDHFERFAGTGDLLKPVPASPAAETRSAILRDEPGLMDELQKMAASVGGVFVPNDKTEREKYIACLNARATAFETAIEAVKSAAPADTGVWSAYREWALRSIPDLERMRDQARREAGIAGAGAKA